MFRRNSRRLFCASFNFLFNHSFIFYVIGTINKRWRFLETIYVGYSVDDEYTQEYSFPSQWLRARYQWSPFLAGVVIQNKKLGLKFFISSFEDDFYNPENKGELISFVSKVERIRELTHASQKTFAGVLPGVLYMARIIRTMSETEVVVESVFLAIKKIQTLEAFPEDTPLIVLGGKGFIGRRVIKRLKGREVYCVDKDKANEFSSSWPSCLNGKKTILINISRQFVLRHYIPHTWPSLVLLNEVYPEPSPNEVIEYGAKGGGVYHLAGVKGLSIPSFPKAYTGSIPCSASHMNDNLQVVVKKLS